MLIAVDGGYEFFRKAKLTADLLIGDFDSLVPFPSKLPKETLVVPFPREKAMTDTELAIHYAIKSGITEINVVMPEVGEVDQFLGVVIGLTANHLRPRKIAMTIWTAKERIWLLRRGASRITGKPGDQVSVIPLSATIELSWSGTHYDVDKLSLERGVSTGLRNKLRLKTATVTIQGEGLVVHRDAPAAAKKGR